MSLLRPHTAAIPNLGRRPEVPNSGDAITGGFRLELPPGVVPDSSALPDELPPSILCRFSLGSSSTASASAPATKLSRRISILRRLAAREPGSQDFKAAVSTPQQISAITTEVRTRKLKQTLVPLALEFEQVEGKKRSMRGSAAAPQKQVLLSTPYRSVYPLPHWSRRLPDHLVLHEPRRFLQPKRRKMRRCSKTYKKNVARGWLPRATYPSTERTNPKRPSWRVSPLLDAWAGVRWEVKASWLI
ncbi:hypothetical protein B296_00015806 [Ensete ventricosum]|uniref:Uncharacterized protein n=1 Tax=Ensete ventricosum TaxID=4639 RepID=A0A426YC24_ENSVE|nr:hypothetical protein B296_00015806 [Ensete ventricosum]